MPYANSYSDEGTLTGTKTIVFPWKPKELQITNDSGTSSLQYRFNTTEGYRTLKPYETSTLRGISIRSLHLNGISIPYRVWGLG